MKRISIFGLALIVSIGLASCGNSQSHKSSETNSEVVAQNAPIAQNVNPAQFQELIKSKQNGVILDVRTPQEVAEGSIAGHINIDVYDSEFKEKLNTLDKNVPVLVYCRSGGRSGKAMQIMQEMGFKEVYNMSGGMMEWTNQGLPVK